MHKEKPRAKILIRWSRIVDGSVVIESHSPVTKVVLSSNHILFSLAVLATFALFVLFWLGLALNHCAHTPTTTFFH